MSAILWAAIGLVRDESKVKPARRRTARHSTSPSILHDRRGFSSHSHGFCPALVFSTGPAILPTKGRQTTKHTKTRNTRKEDREESKEQGERGKESDSLLLPSLVP